MEEIESSQTDDVTQLKQRVQELERERDELLERSNRIVAESQRKTYWLERWHIDLNKLMRKRWTEDTRASLRIFRAGIRRVRNRYRKFRSDQIRKRQKTL